VTDANGAGYTTGVGEIACDRGGAEALDLEEGTPYYVVALYFGTEADATRFVDLFEPDASVPAKVTLFCLD
jgi:hypothetical protein